MVFHKHELLIHIMRKRKGRKQENVLVKKKTKNAHGRREGTYPKKEKKVLKTGGFSKKKRRGYERQKIQEAVKPLREAGFDEE